MKMKIDIVSFISGSNFVIFDPHGRDLPDKVLGLYVLID